MLLSSKRKFNNIEKTESTTVEVKKSKVLQTCGLSTLPVDENIPQNMQQGSPDHSANVNKLASTDLKESPNDFECQKPLRRNRLNLKKVKSGSQARGHEDQNENECKTESYSSNKLDSTVFAEECSSKVKDTEKFNRKDGESLLKYTGKHKLADIHWCPVCRINVSMLKNDADLNKHINNCLDNINNSTTSRESSTTTDQKEVYFCQICGRDMSKYSTIQCQQHLNRCCDSTEEAQSQGLVVQKQLPCLICGKICKTSKSRQSHMKSCAKKNNVSTGHLVELNRHEKKENQSNSTGTKESISGPGVNIDGGKPTEKALAVFRSNKKKKHAKLQTKNLDEETQLALALSASLHPNAKDTKLLEKKARKKHKGPTELPALLLRSDDEMKRVTEARAAAVLCHWADSDDEIKCTPALAPSLLLGKYGTNSEAETHSSDAVDQLETISEHTEPENEDNIELFTGKHGKRDMVVYKEKLERKNADATIDKASLEKSDDYKNSNKIPPVLPSAAKDDGDERYMEVDEQTRLWRVASLSADKSGFYVPNLLPKTNPRKTTVVVNSNTQASKEREYHSDAKKDSPAKLFSRNDGITESQEMDIQLLAELVGEDDIQSNVDEDEDSGQCEQTWYPSSGFCVAKDVHSQVDKKNKNIDQLLKDLSGMVGNPFLSDVEIVAKDKQRFFAHSFMLATRCKTLAKMLREEKTSNSADENSEDFTSLEMVDIDIRAVHAVMTYIYTASFVPVPLCIMEDLRKLVKRLNLDCAVHSWEEMKDEADYSQLLPNSKDGMEVEFTRDGDAGNLDVLLKSLWEGEGITDNTAEEEDEAFGDSVLDEELDDMEIKIYTQLTPRNNCGSGEGGNGVELHNSEGNKKANRENVIKKFILHLDSNEDKPGMWTSTHGRDDLPADKSIMSFEDDSLRGNNDQSNVEKESISHALAPASCSISSLKSSRESNPMENKDEDISSDSDGWFVPETPRRISDSISQFSSHESQTESVEDIATIQYDILLADVSKPGKPSQIQQQQERDHHQLQQGGNGCLSANRFDVRNSYVNSQPFSAAERNFASCTSALTSQRCSTPDRTSISSSPVANQTVVASQPSLVKISVSPTSPNKSFFARNNDTPMEKDTDIREAKEPECHLLRNSRLAQSKTSSNITENNKKIMVEDMNVDRADQSILSSTNLSSPERVSDLENDLNDNGDDCAGDFYDNQDIDFYDDGGFNCDIDDYFAVDDVKMSTNKFDTDLCPKDCEKAVGEIENVDELICYKTSSFKDQVKDNREKGIITKRTQTPCSKSRNVKSQNSTTPMLDYSNMGTPDLLAELKQYGVRPLPKRKMIIKLKEIYHYTHRDTASDSEGDDTEYQRQGRLQRAQYNLEKPSKSATHEKNSAEGGTQDSGEFSESGSSKFDDDISEDGDVLSQESSLNLSEKLIAYITQNSELYRKILKYEPISLASLQEMLKDNGIKCSNEKLKDFLDEQCITFTEPRTARPRKKQRYAQPKSRKNN